MKIRSKVFCLIEGIGFVFYCRTLRYPAVERIGWQLYWKLFRGLCLLLRPFDNLDRLAAQELYLRSTNEKGPQLTTKRTASRL
jgi:hypothetical protein